MIMKIVIIDDDPIAIAHLEQQLKEVDDLEVVKTFLDPELGKAYILENNIDAVFLDIHFRGITGLEIAEEINQQKPNIVIALVSSYEKYAVDAFELSIIDYILKPVELDRLETTINRIRKQLKRQGKMMEQKAVHLQVCRRLAFKVTNQYEPIAWRTAKTQELFLYLLQYNEASISNEALMEVLWPESKESFSLLYTTIHHVRAVLEDYKSSIQLINCESGYRLTLNNVKVDLIDWENEILRLPDLSSNIISDYELVMKKNTGAYLSEYDYIWAESERFRLEELWTSVALEIAKYYMSTCHDDIAIGWYLAIRERNPVEERAYFSLMKIYRRKKRPSKVRKYYEDLVKTLKEELDVKPSEYITIEYKKWEKYNKLIEQ